MGSFITVPTSVSIAILIYFIISLLVMSFLALRVKRLTKFIKENQYQIKQSDRIKPSKQYDASSSTWLLQKPKLSSIQNSSLGAKSLSTSSSPKEMAPPTHDKIDESKIAINDSRVALIPNLASRNSFHKNTDVKIQLTDEFLNTLLTLEHTNHCIFVTGEAGTGKSTLLRYFVQNTSKRVIVLAPTGIAALNAGGQTIHKFFKFPLKPLSRSDIKAPRNAGIFKKIDAIIIDEISMVRADIIDAIDWSLRMCGPEPSQPFGGIQLIFFGDLFQLPPIVSGKVASQFFGQNYKSPYFFDAKVFDEDFSINVIKLQHVYRQQDQTFIGILNRIRIGRFTQDDLNALNARYNRNFEPSQKERYITLCATNSLADNKNRVELDALTTEEFIYEGKIEGSFDNKSYPTEYSLLLKEGAQVMFVKNDMEGRWVNGTIGIVEELRDGKIKIRIPTPVGQPKCIHEVQQVTWEVTNYKLNNKKQSIDSSVVGSFTQYPLKLAWAVTIHKSQGKTFEKVIINLGGGAFAHGQAYVGLSRCTSLEGMVLRTQLKNTDVIVDKRVFRFLDKLSVLPKPENIRA